MQLARAITRENKVVQDNRVLGGKGTQPLITTLYAMIDCLHTLSRDPSMIL